MTEIIASEQQQAVLNWAKTQAGHLNLIARAGCGKTFTLLWLVPQLAGQIIFLAFNKSIAEEVKEKLANGGIDWKKCEAATFHAIGFRAWRKVADKGLKVENKKVSKIIEIEAKHAYNTKNDIYGDVLTNCNQFLCQLISLAKQNAFGHLTNIDDSNAWQRLIDHHDLEYQCMDTNDDELIYIAKKIYRMSLDQCKKMIDFDDMILAPLVFNARVWQYKWVMVDEAQDTNPARRALAMKLLRKDGRLIAVGDPKQAIYGFTGADANSMQIISDQLGSAELPLNVTYRCPKSVVEHANYIVPDIVAHETAPMGSVETIEMNPSTEDDETCFCSDTHIKALDKDTAILCRNTRPLISLAYDLLSKGIGCLVEGRDIGNGLINLAKRWKKIKTVKALVNRLETYRDSEIQKAMSKGMEAKAQTIEDKVSALLVICEHVGMDARITDIENEINNMFGSTKDKNVVTLSTVHKSKGREWKKVYLLGRNKYMPSTYARQAWQVEQESNLIYVAITRAQEKLIEVNVPLNNES